MKKGLLILFLFACILPRLQAQDLELVTGSLTVTPSSIHIGSNMSVSFHVRNNGTVNAGKTYTGIYLSTSGSLVGATLLSEISLEELSPGSISEVKYIHPIPYSISGGNNFVVVSLNNQNSISETNTSNNISVSSVINIDLAPWAQQNLPYPIIFIHGYNGANTTWDTLITFMQNTYGYSYGGKMDFCLNSDSSNSTSELFADFHDFFGELGHLLNPLPCDMYTINFANNPDGSYPYNESFLSNQAAAYKQGYAVKKAIEHVLNITGKDKVILVCHSMGGLAARVYLQNSSWNQPSDNKKHVAKLCTIGTPHGGSLIGSGPPFGTGLPAILGYDLQSDAMRDLRTGYFYSYYYPFPALTPSPGTLLFGGLEELDYMVDHANMLILPPNPPIPISPINFYNADVDCDGNALGQAVAGINHKSISSEINFSSIIGYGEPLPINGDGVVTEHSQNINNFLSVDADTFMIPDIDLFSIWHLKLTKQVADILKGMDEPNSYSYNHSYQVSSGQLYSGLFTYQSASRPFRDKDYYHFYMPSNGILSLEVFNIPTPIFSINIFNSSQNNIYTLKGNGKSYLNVGATLPAGNYYIEFSGLPTIDSWKFPYSFMCTYTPSTIACFGTTIFTSNTGAFTDGSDSNNYNNNSDCKWLIQPSGATNITLGFTSFDVNSTDTVYIYDGGAITSPILAKLNGSSLPLNITSSAGKMLLRFVSDSAFTYSGWDANYSATVIPTFCSGGNVLNSPNGVFTDGSDTANYAHNSHCSWLISPSNAYTVTLDFTTFNVDSTNDIVNVYDGFDTSFPLIGSFSGNGIPPTITSTGGSLFLEFITDDTISSKGWRASYTSSSPAGHAFIVEYEYWYDDDYANTITFPVVSQNILHINTSFPTTNLSFGFHTLHVRFKDNNSIWSSVTSKYFYKENKLPTGANHLKQCQYWFDDDFANRVDSFIVPPQYQYSFTQSFPLLNLANGLHTLNIRFLDNNKVWSSVLSKHFFKTTVSQTGQFRITNYRYWFDSSSSILINKQFSTPLSQQILFDTLSTIGLINGNHLFHIQFQDETSQWSSVLTDTFLLTNCLVNPPPLISGVDSICEGNTLHLSVTGGDFYNWTGPLSFSSNIPAPQIPNVTVANGGYYSVVVSSVEGCTSKDSLEVIISLSPTISSFLPASGPIGTTVTLSGNNFSVVNEVKISGQTAVPVILNNAALEFNIPAGAVTDNIIVNTANACSDTSALAFLVVNISQLNLKLFVEGYYTGSNLMSTPLQDPLHPTHSDSLIVALYDSTNLNGGAVFTVAGVVDVNGNVFLTFPPAVIGNRYYIVVRHRSSIETWSKHTVLFSQTTLFDFTN